MGTALLNEFHFSSAQKGFLPASVVCPSAALGSIRPDSWGTVKELKFNKEFGSLLDFFSLGVESVPIESCKLE